MATVPAGVVACATCLRAMLRVRTLSISIGIAAVLAGVVTRVTICIIRAIPLAAAPGSMRPFTAYGGGFSNASSRNAIIAEGFATIARHATSLVSTRRRIKRSAMSAVLLLLPIGLD